MNSSLTEILKTWTPSFHGNPLNELISLSGTCFFGQTWMIKVNPKRKYKFNENLTHCEDLLFFINIAEDGIYKFVDKPILKYRTGHNSAMKNLGGLEDGYFQVLDEIKLNKKITLKQIHQFKRKIVSIMFKSYLKKGALFPALKVIFRYK